MKKNRSKILTLLLALTIIATLAGCGQTAPQTTTSATASTAAVTATPEASATASTAATEEYAANPSGNVSVWGWDESEMMEKHLSEVFPNVTVGYTTIAQADLPSKITTTLASGTQMPDVIQLEATTRGKMYSLGCWENLSAAPYNMDSSIFTGDQIPVSVDGEGNLLGLPMGAVPSAMAYKRGLAKQYFGTDDPEELGKMFQTWNDYIVKGKEVTQKSGGKVWMFAGLSDLYNVFINQTIIPYTIDNKINVKDSLSGALGQLIEFKKAGIVDTLEEASPALYASYADDTHIFYPAAQWSPRWIIKPNDKRDGAWGLMELAQGAVNWGGGVYSIPKTALNKEAAFAVIRWLTSNPDSAKPRRDELQAFCAIKSVFEDPTFYSRKDSFFGGEDIDALFAYKIIPKMDKTNVRPLNKYDVEVGEAVDTALKTINASKDGSVDLNALITQVEDDILSRCPDLSR